MKIHKYIFVAFAVLFAFCSKTYASSTIDKQLKQAEKFYANAEYEQALHIYRNLAKNGNSADLFYNMGNCYFKLDSIPQALLWYERAYLLSPGDNDIRHNLQYARTKTIDKIVPEEEIFFVRWYRSLLNCFSVEGWTIAGIILFALSLAALCMFFFLSSTMLRKVGFFGSIVLFIFVLCANIFAYQQKQRQLYHEHAIVFDSSISGKSSPNQAGKELFLLHEGTNVTIIDTNVKNWLQVRLPDGKQGWIPASSVEVI